MATHALRRHARRARLLVRAWRVLRRNWIAFWFIPSTTAERTGRHEKIELRTFREHEGATETFVPLLRSLNALPEDESPLEGIGPADYHALLTDALVICGTPLERVQGHVLVGNPYDQNGGAL